MRGRTHSQRHALLALAVTTVLEFRASALTINPTFSANVFALSNASQVVSAFNYAVDQYEQMYTNPITINIDIDTMSSGLSESFGTRNVGFAYSTIRNAFIANETTSDQATNIASNFPVADPTGANSQWEANTAQQKALGLLSANNSVLDGSVLFNPSAGFSFDPYDRTVTTGFDFIGAAEHEISEVMGRTPELGTMENGHPTYKSFDLNRFSAPGVRNFVGTNPGYFSIDGGNTNLKNFNSTPPGDADDWAGPTSFPDPTYVPDSYNAFSAPDNTNALTPVDAEVMDILGYNRSSTALTMKAGFNDFLIGDDWSSTTQSGLNPFHGVSMLINSSSATAHHEFTAGENFVLASNSDMGQSMEVRAGYLELNDSGGAVASGFGLEVNQDGTLTVDGTGQLYAQGPISVGETAGVTNAQALISGNSYIIVGNPAESETFYVGDSGAGTVVQNGTSSVTTPSLVLGNVRGSFGGYTLADTASLTVTGGETIGNNGSGNFTQNGGTHKITGTLIVTVGSGSGTFDLAGGTLNAGGVQVQPAYTGSSSTLEQYGGTLTTGTVQVFSQATYYLENGNVFAAINNSGTFEFDNGFLVGNITNTDIGTFAYTGGTLAGSFTNQGVFSLFSNFTVPYSFLNEAPFTLTAGITLAVNGSGIDNERYIYLSGGTLAGTGTKTNDATIQGDGTISGSGELINSGTITETSGSLVFSMSGNPYYNYASINLETNIGELDLTTPNSPTSDRLVNAGALRLNGSVVDGAGGFENASGGTVYGPGKFNNTYFVNDAGGAIFVPAGTLNIVPGFSNAGTITLTDPAANLTGGAITNTGTIEGVGTVANGITNTGTIQPGTGTLVFSGLLTNSSGGTLSLPAGGTILATGTVGVNSGAITLAGGTLDLNGGSLNNVGQISGHGTINASLITTGHFGSGTIALSGGDSTLNTPINNVHNVSVSGSSALFNGNMSNSGFIQVTNANVIFAGTLSSYSYLSSGTMNTFQNNVSVYPEAGAVMSGGNADQFYLSGGTFTNGGSFTNTGLLESSDPTINNGTFSQTGSLLQGGGFTNNATATIGGMQTWVSGTIFTNAAGTATFLTDAGSATTLTMSMNVTGGKVILSSPQHWAAVSIGGGAVDVVNNHLIVSSDVSDPFTTLLGYVATGRDSGVWDGPGLQSSSAAANSFYSLGCVDGAAGIVPGLPADEVEVAYTIYGDINLDGAVNGTDFGILAAHFGQSVTGGWEEGDLNYDGVVNGTDFSLMAENFGKSAQGQAVALPESEWAALDAFASAHGLLADVPEPGATGGLLIALAITSARRRHKFHLSKSAS